LVVDGTRFEFKFTYDRDLAKLEKELDFVGV